MPMPQLVCLNRESLNIDSAMDIVQLRVYGNIEAQQAKSVPDSI